MQILTSSRSSDRVFDKLPLVSRACMLKLKEKDQLLCLLHVHGSNAVSDVPKYTWHNLVRRRSLYRLLHCFVKFVFGSVGCSSKRWGRIVNSTDHHFIACSLRISKPCWLNEKSSRSRRTRKCCNSIHPAWKQSDNFHKYLRRLR